MPIAGDGCGNYFVLALNSADLPLRPVYFIDHEVDFGVPGYAVASGLWHFLRGVLRKERGDFYWPFKAKQALALDPDLKRIRGAPLPWKANKK